MKRKLITWLAITPLVLAALLIPAARYAKEQAGRAVCRDVLHCCIRKAMVMYSMDHDGQYPKTLADLASEYVSQPKLFICKSSGTIPGSMTNVDEWCDYIYLHWEDGTNTPPHYPWLYERRLSNHGGGIYVAPIEGDAFWDENASWLRKFAKDHPELDISLPVDVD
jgi:hypothetical protein